MKLDSCTPQQRSIITTLDKPLMVSAGAGSGKTFTLTQRIAYALEPDEHGNAFAQDINEVLAITFTKKAASELKSRIKRKLLDMGLVDQALKVDDAWISTIHGMCSRMLHEHALELGIDPAFEIISETDAHALKDEAFDTVVDALGSKESPSFDRGLSDYLNRVGIHAAMGNAASIETYVSKITDRALALPGGFDALVVPEITGNPQELLRSLIVLGETFLEISTTLQKPLKADAGYQDACADALQHAKAYLEKGIPTSFTDPLFDWDQYVRVFFAFPKTTPKYRVKESDPGFFAEYRSEYALLAGQVEAACSALEQHYLARIARMVYEQYQQLKGSARLDNVDLLRETYSALSQYPAIAQAYRNQFALIMIDEFQDTDELQIALLRALAKPGLTNVCTVGDAQQSIYRFRGADVSVFYAFRELLAHSTDNAQFVNLPDNFRSHADVLSFVDAIFSQDQVFGKRFLSLVPKGEVNREPDELFDNRPRINMALFDCRSGGAGSAAGRRKCAARIAQHFAALRDDGAKPSDMALLLGSMSQVDIYARALRDAGFECLVSGGSVFANSLEVGLIKTILLCLENRFDDGAWYELLSSPLFQLSDDDLLYLATFTDREHKPHRRLLTQGFLSWDKERDLSGLSDASRDRIDFARICVQSCYRVLDGQGIASAVLELLRASGWFYCLQSQGAQGQAMVGNIHKALRMIADIEEEGLGLARSVAKFIDSCATLKLAPGSLSTASSDFVKIMTVHASKGLEFPHVAIAEVRITGKTESLIAENIEGKTYVTLQPEALSSVRDTVKALHAYRECPDDLQDAVIHPKSQSDRERALEALVADQELEEARRLLYVALTRAGKSLFLGIVYRGKKTPSYEGKGILDDLYQAFGWEVTQEAPQQRFEYGGSAPLALEMTILDSPEEEQQETCQAAEAFVIPDTPPKPLPYALPFRVGHDEVFSYSSLGEVAPVLPPFDSVGAPVQPTPENMFARAPELVQPAADNMFVDLERSLDDDATALGLAFHRLAQGAINRVHLNGGEGALVMPDGVTVEARMRSYRLSPEQQMRLKRALVRWFASDCAHEFAQHTFLRAEVPFMIALGDGASTVYLEGEIDGLAYDEMGKGAAYLIDYKTGGSFEETPDQLYVKHLMQAQCYACGLLQQGFDAVEAKFVRVEWDDPALPGQPWIQSYTFTQKDLSRLKLDILQAYNRSLN
ncbi:MAG: UvrD-helicase domain-containing protein [Eggerthellaceae bacterium]